MSKSRNYYRRMWYKLQAKKVEHLNNVTNELLESYKSCIKKYNSSLSCSSIVDVPLKVKASTKYGDDVRTHWFETDTTKAIYAKFKNHRVEKLQKDVETEIVKTKNVAVRNKEDEFKVHKAISIVNRNPILYDRSVKINDCKKYKLA